VRPGEPGGGDDPVDRHRRVGQCDVVAHRAVEQDVVLQDNTDLSAKPGGVDHRQIYPVDKNPPPFRDVEALDQLGERAFARARGADDADDLSGRHLEADIRQYLRRIDPVTEGDVLESNIAADRRQGGAHWVETRLRHSVEDIAEPLHREARLVEVLPHLR
jgi:hypothetical protein